MSAMFWAIATSDVALIAVGALFVTCLVVGHLPLIGRLLPAVEPYTVAASLLAYLLLAQLALAIGFRAADERAEVARLTMELNWHQFQLEQQKVAAAFAEQKADENRERAATLQEEVNDYADRLSKQPPPPACAFDDDDVRSLRALGGASGRPAGPRDLTRLRKPRR
ncbi:hypothetical protein AC629_40425 [Bradyrhizobium sp. NAS80.1]|uniref:hypothetical protein n=1 Tax=Bradyrhizobium sp. NAS80.1 TaxID=1680159 RepID=UPI00095B681C|nr:hypothetical protein [Bradyrhizobium sp. NAS80.1]OKO70393.1 hypothetical protein AC629_40425 [Bradyrhizobium sp. NAS80.1]